MNPIVNSYPPPARHHPIAAIGEAPGYEEACKGVPLVGPTGREHAAFLHHFGIHPSLVWRSNVTREYKDGNPDPSPADVARWAPVLEAELSVVQPRLILALGRFAAEWFLGPIPLKYPMRSINSVPHEGGAFDAALAHRANGAPVVPVIHPAAGLRDSKQRVLVAWGYEQAARVWKALEAGSTVELRRGPFDWRNHEGDYRWVRNSPGRDGLPWSTPEAALAECVRSPYLGLDTEGSASCPWSLQISPRPGLSFVAVARTPECAQFVHGLNRQACSTSDDAPLWIIHNALHDIEVAEREDDEEETDAPPVEYDADGEVEILDASTALGLRLHQAKVADTMHMLYVLRREPLGLKPAAWRWLNVAHLAYMQVIGRTGIRAQLDYLEQVAGRSWTAPERAVYRSNSGRPASWKPTPLHKRATAILKRIDKGEDVDISTLWTKRESERYRRQMLSTLRKEVEDRLGPLPEPTLADVDPSDALWYAGADPDLGLQIHHALLPVLEEMDLVRTDLLGRHALPAAAEVQISGMPVSRPYFVAFEQELTSACDEVQDELSTIMPPKKGQEEKQYKLEKTAERYFPGCGLLGGSLYPSRFDMPDDEEKGRILRYLTPLPATDSHPIRFCHHWTESAPYFNPNSSPDTLRLIHEVLGLQPLKTSRKTGLPSTAKDSIAHLQYGRDPDGELTSAARAVGRLFEWRSMNKIRQFADDVLASTREEDPFPRMYERVSMTRTESRRWAQGRLMTIPARSSLAIRVRQGYEAAAGRLLVAADFSSVEPRVAAHLSGDPRMLSVFYENRDIYIETASGVWGIPREQVSKAQRSICKPLFLGAGLYGMGWTGYQASLRQQQDTDGNAIDLSKEECEAHIKGLRNTFPQFFRWGEAEVVKAAKQGYVRDPHSGMYRFLPALYVSDRSDWRGRSDYAEACRHVVNHRIQTLAQFMIQNSMIWLHGQLRSMRQEGRLSKKQILLVLLMHDELILECDADDKTVELAESLLVEALDGHHGLACTVPITCEVCKGRTWRDLKG